MSQKYTHVLIGSVICLLACSFAARAETPAYADYVNPLVGTDSTFNFSTGNTYPAIAVPWGMNFWTPQTNNHGRRMGLSVQMLTRSVGFKQTHQPSPWINDYAAFSFMPVVGDLVVDQEKRGCMVFA